MSLNLQNYILLVAGLVNLTMSIFIFSRGWKNKINLYFSLMTFFNFLWAISLLLSMQIQDNYIAELSYRTAYVAAIGIAVSLFHFLLNFPYRYRNLNIYIDKLMLIISIVVSILIFSDIHIISFIRDYDKSILLVEHNRLFYIFYSVFFFVIVICSIYFLIKQISLLDRSFKNKARIFLITVIIGLVFGSYFDLVLCFFNNWDYIWFGPAFTAFMNAYVLYLIFINREKTVNG